MSLKDFTTLEDLVSNAIPEGSYTITLTDIQSGLTSKKKTPHVTFKYTEEATGQKDYLAFYITEKGVKVLGTQLRKCNVEGFKVPTFSEDPETLASNWAESLTPMVGKSFKADFTIEVVDDGIQRNRVRITGTADGAPLVLSHQNVI